MVSRALLWVCASQSTAVALSPLVPSAFNLRRKRRQTKSMAQPFADPKWDKLGGWVEGA